jgi:NAD(P)-dependent dehydrogenase (short-subunit alcohol dehydrogenase family)
MDVTQVSNVAMHGKVALVTGGNSGIGHAAALAFARRGATVVVAARRADEGAQTVRVIRESGGVAHFIQTDVAREDDIKALIAGILERYERLDIAFNNAGVEGAFAPITELTADDFDYTIAINLRGVWLSLKYELEAMLKLDNGGAIVNTSSWLAHGAFPGSSIYSASKAALDGMIRAVAQEGADKGIRVNNINPGIIDTPMLRRFGDDTTLQPFVDHTPARRFGTPEDVAEVVVWLCSDAARFVTGQNILVDGGYAIPGHRAWLAGSVRADLAQS